MSSTHRRKIVCGIILIVAMVLCVSASAQTAKPASADERLIGAWHLVRIDAPGPDGKFASGPQPKGMLIYTRDGHMSVQLMYPASANTVSNEYVRNGYEASFGGYDVDEAAHTVTHHIQGSITGDLLVGKDLPRRFEFTSEGNLVIRSTRPDEHWFVTWAHY
jgi:hypothetical protein